MADSETGCCADDEVWSPLGQPSQDPGEGAIVASRGGPARRASSGGKNWRFQIGNRVG